MFQASHRKLAASLAALTLTCTGIAWSASAARVRWTSPGSAAIPQTGYEDDIQRVGSRLMMPPGSGSYAKAVFPVNGDSLLSPDVIALSARFKDTGSNDRLRIYLKEFRHDTGLTYTRLLLDSNTRPGSTSPQLMYDEDENPGWGFESPNAVFFVEVRLYKYGSTTPSLYSLSLEGAVE
jgi:hypothetical protein